MKMKILNNEGEIQCEDCGQIHKDWSIDLAKIIMNGNKIINTKWGSKNKCGIACMIELVVYSKSK